MIEFTINNFISIARQIVMYSKADSICNRLNGFAVIDNKFNFDTDKFESKAYKKFYFSRDNERLLFPALVFSFNAQSLGRFKNGKYNDYCHPMEIGIVDEVYINKKDCTPCEKRNVEEIYFDTGKLLRNLFNELSQIKLYKAVKGLDTTFIYSVKGLMDIFVTENIYDSYTVVSSESNVYEMMYEKTNPLINFGQLPLTKMNTVGNWASFTICEFCGESGFEYAYKEYKNQECC